MLFHNTKILYVFIIVGLGLLVLTQDNITIFTILRALILSYKELTQNIIKKPLNSNIMNTFNIIKYHSQKELPILLYLQFMLCIILYISFFVNTFFKFYFFWLIDFIVLYYMSNLLILLLFTNTQVSRSIKYIFVPGVITIGGECYLDKVYLMNCTPGVRPSGSFIGQSVRKYYLKCTIDYEGLLLKATLDLQGVPSPIDSNGQFSNERARLILNKLAGTPGPSIKYYKPFGLVDIPYIGKKTYQPFISPELAKEASLLVSQENEIIKLKEEIKELKKKPE